MNQLNLYNDIPQDTRLCYVKTKMSVFNYSRAITLFLLHLIANGSFALQPRITFSSSKGYD